MTPEQKETFKQWFLDNLVEGNVAGGMGYIDIHRDGIEDFIVSISEYFDSIEHTAEIIGMKRFVDEVIGGDEDQLPGKLAAEIQNFNLDVLVLDRAFLRNKLRRDQRQKAQQLIKEANNA